MAAHFNKHNKLWDPTKPLSRDEYDYFIDLLTSTMGQLTAIKKRISMMEEDVSTKLECLRKLPHECQLYVDGYIY